MATIIDDPSGTGTAAAAENARLLAQGYHAFATGDMATLNQTFSPDIVWHVQRLGILSGHHRGWDAVLAFFGRSMALTNGTFRVTPLEVLANGEGAAAVVRSQGERNGRALDDRQIHHFHIRDGRVVEVWQFIGDAEATHDFWS